MSPMTATLARGDHVTVAGYGGVAFWVIGHPVETWKPTPVLICDGEDDDDHDEYCYGVIDEPETYEDTGKVIVRMVGDDKDHIVDAEDVTPLDREAFCGQCGQIGCSHDGAERGIHG